MKTNFFAPNKKVKKSRPEMVANHFEKSPESLLERVLGNHTLTPENAANADSPQLAESGRRGESVVYQRRPSQRVEQGESNQFHSLRAEIQSQLTSLDHSANQSTIFEAKKNTVLSNVKEPGVYHVNFFKHILSGLARLRIKAGEGKSWMNAMQTKKAKRGSLFAARSKSKGTQYSNSAELSTSRSVM